MQVHALICIKYLWKAVPHLDVTCDRNMLAPPRKSIYMVGPLQICYVLCSVWQAAKRPINIYVTPEVFQTFIELLGKKRKKKKKSRGWGEKGYPVAHHQEDLDFCPHFLSPPMLEKLSRQMFSVACHLVAIQEWPLHK